jgi:hypothetical protein
MWNHVFYSQSVYEENYLNPYENIHKLILKLYRSHMPWSLHLGVGSKRTESLSSTWTT